MVVLRDLDWYLWFRFVVIAKACQDSRRQATVQPSIRQFLVPLDNDAYKFINSDLMNSISAQSIELRLASIDVERA